MRCEKMVALNQERSSEKIKLAISTMQRLFDNDEQIVVSRLVKETQLSRSFFYNNKEVHDRLINLQEKQKGKSFVRRQKVILDGAMDQEIKLLKKKLLEKDEMIQNQEKEIKKLNKLIESQTRTIIERL